MASTLHRRVRAYLEVLASQRHLRYTEPFTIRCDSARDAPNGWPEDAAELAREVTEISFAYMGPRRVRASLRLALGGTAHLPHGRPRPANDRLGGVVLVFP